MQEATERGSARRNFGASTRISFFVTSSLTVENLVSGMSTLTMISRQLMDELSCTLQAAPKASSLVIFWRYLMSYFGRGLLSPESTLLRSRPSPTSSSSQIWFGSTFLGGLPRKRQAGHNEQFCALVCRSFSFFFHLSRSDVLSHTFHFLCFSG